MAFVSAAADAICDGATWDNASCCGAACGASSECMTVGGIAANAAMAVALLLELAVDVTLAGFAIARCGSGALAIAGVATLPKLRGVTAAAFAGRSLPNGRL